MNLNTRDGSTLHKYTKYGANLIGL